MNNGKRSDRVKNMLCFIPLFWLVIYFLEKEKTERLNKNVVYAIFLFVIFILFGIILKFWISFFLYIFASGFLGYKAYLGEDVDIEFLDKIFLKK